MVINNTMKSRMVIALHRSHGSVKGMKAKARDAMFWAGDECQYPTSPR